jgi:hypothetical protein
MAYKSPPAFQAGGMRSFFPSVRELFKFTPL